MQAFQAQRTEEFLSQVGTLLTEAVAEQQTPWQQQAMHELGAYIQAARSAQRISVESFARQLALSETETYALEQGIFPYARLTLPLLEKVAAACREEKDVLLALLHGAQHQPVAQSAAQAGVPASDTMPHHQLSQPLAGRCSVAVGKNCVHDSRQQSTAKTQALPQKHKRHKRFSLPISLFWGQLRPFYSGFSRVQVNLGCQLLHKIAASLSITWKLSTLNLSHPAVRMVAAASLCYFVLLHFGLLSSNPFSSVGMSEQTAAVTDLSAIYIAEEEQSVSIPTAMSGGEAVGWEVEDRETVSHPKTFVRAVASDSYEIIYTTDVMSNHHVATSPLIPVSGHKLAFIQTHERIPRIFYLCRIIGKMESCPM